MSNERPVILSDALPFVIPFLPASMSSPPLPFDSRCSPTPPMSSDSPSFQSHVGSAAVFGLPDDLGRYPRRGTDPIHYMNRGNNTSQRGLQDPSQHADTRAGGLLLIMLPLHMLLDSMNLRRKVFTRHCYDTSPWCTQANHVRAFTSFLPSFC